MYRASQQQTTFAATWFGSLQEERVGVRAHQGDKLATNSSQPTHESLDDVWLCDVIIGNDEEVDRDTGEDDGTADARLHRRGDHGDQGDKD